MANASDKMRGTTTLEKSSGFSAVADARAAPDVPIPRPAPRAATPIVKPPEKIRKAPSAVSVAGGAGILNRDRSPTTKPYIARASARIVAIKLLDTISGLSVPAPAIAGAEMLIPRAAPMTDRRRLRLTPRPAHMIGSTTSWHNPACRFLIGREWQTTAFIKLAKPLDPVKPQSLNENNQPFNNHN